MNPFKKLAGQTAVYGLPTIVGRLLNYLLVPLYTRVFLPAEYGVVTEMYAYVSFLFVILTYGMETAYFRFSTSLTDRSRVFSTSIISLLFTSTFFVLIIFMFSDNIALLMGYSEHPEYIKWFSLILAADALCSIPYAYLRLNNKALRFAFVKVTNIAVNIAFNLLFILLIPYILKNYPVSPLSLFFQSFYNESIGVGYIFISNLIASLLTLIMLLPAILKVKLQIDNALLRNMLRYAWPLLIFGLAGIINETFDRIILKYMLPDKSTAMAQLGIYGACYKISILMTLFIQTYRYAAEPFFFDQSGKKDAKIMYARLMHYFIIICLFIYLAITLNLDLVLLFVGKDFREGAAVVPILLWANLFLGVFYNLSIWFKLTDRTKKGAMISIAGAIITLTLNFILIPTMGYLGAAWATFICYGFMMVLSWILGQKYYPINYYIKPAGLYTLITLIIYGISLYTNRLDFQLKMSINFLLLLSYILVVYLKEKRITTPKSL
ncbi:MAG TPA: polysaccharide biosynthesis C-terminal domain-containing protein [Lentimicrobium sp.]|nr:polysaccharide biosynthesis C-terminal domain-containing protein [Lentimicrobium sp.]